MQALRVGDPGVHTATCCGKNEWVAAEGSPTVIFNDLPAHRKSDATRHCGGSGVLFQGSSDVIIGGGQAETSANTGSNDICKNQALIYLLFYVTGNERGDNFFNKAAQTRLQNIKASKGYNPEVHKAHCEPIQRIDEVISIVKRYITIYGGEDFAFCKEVGVFSHAGFDGPAAAQEPAIDPIYMEGPVRPPQLGPGSPKPTYQMGMNGWSQIGFNWWTEQPLFVAYGCNSANESIGLSHSFARNLSQLPNFSNVEVWGQSTFSFPSFMPNFRTTTLERSLDFNWDWDATYQVGGLKDQGALAIIWRVAATPMNCYKNDAKVRSTHQGYFNNGRVQFTLVSV